MVINIRACFHWIINHTLLLSGRKRMEIKCFARSLCQESVEANSVAGVDDSTANRDRPLNILDLNDDCLTVIFMNCSLKQIFSVIVAHTHFSTACRRVFSKRYKHREITLQATNLDNPGVLYFVGDILQHLRVNYGRISDNEGIVHHKTHDAIVHYCSENLFEATFNHIQSTMQVNRVFHRLQQLNFNHGCVGSAMSEFNKWFPNLNRLEFFFCKTIDTRCIEHTFPNLEHFTIAHHNFTLQNLQKFLDLNPQLQTFTVYNYDRAIISQLDAYTRATFKSLTTKFETYPCYFAFDNN